MIILEGKGPFGHVMSTDSRKGTTFGDLRCGLWEIAYFLDMKAICLN